MSNVEIEPCPFCKSNTPPWIYSYAEHRGTVGFSIICLDCKTELGQEEVGIWVCGEFETKAEAVEAWNRRATDGD